METKHANQSAFWPSQGVEGLGSGNRLVYMFPKINEEQRCSL